MEENKEKQIEEAAKSCKNCICNSVCDKKLDLKYFFDNHDCEHYQPKLPKDSVILSKAKYEMLTACSSYEGVIGKLKGEYIKGSKETIEKIFEILYQWLDLENIEKYGFVTIQKFDFLRKFREISKQLGVEIRG